MSSSPPIPAKQAWIHVDMDGLATIFRGHGRAFTGSRDDFYLSAVDNALDLFRQECLQATFFIVAEDLSDGEKRVAIQRIVAEGHRVACHGLHHRYLNRVSTQEKREEIQDAKRIIEDALGVPCAGFRAAGYSIDFESLELLRDAGYRYDSSVFPSYPFRKRLGLQRLFPEPFLILPEDGLFEIPQPYVGPFLPAFHPCYSFYLSRFWFKASLRTFQESNNYLTLLCHLTDFADRQHLDAPLKLHLYTNNFFSREAKLRFMRGVFREVRKYFCFTTTEEFLDTWPDSAPDLNPRTILGISTTHETGACLIRDGQLVAAINEERVSRKKLDNRYPPIESIREVIRISDLSPCEIDAVAIAGLHWKDLVPQSLDSLWTDIRDFHAWNDYVPHLCRVLYRLFYFWRATGYGVALDFLKSEYGVSPKVFYVEHHEAHAASVYFTGAENRALVVTADGVGDDVSITFSRAERSVIRRLEAFFYPNSFGQFYTACTQILGFKGGRHEGKITGLSGFGKEDPSLMRKVEGTYFADDGFRLNKRYYAEGFLRLNLREALRLLRGKLDVLNVEYRNYKMPLKRLLQGYKPEDVAYTFQSLLEREMTRLTRGHRWDGPFHLALAGGVVSNVKLNGALARELDADSVYVFPNMGDGGLCVGAALSVAARPPSPVPDMYAGTAYSELEIFECLQHEPSVTYTRPEDMAETIAQLLVDKRVLARFAGRMEFGPRALGNRSILYHCGDQSVNQWLNHQLRRTEFMPFAPICIYEDADEYFLMDEGEKRPSEFMTIVVKCTDRMMEACPAAVHVDGTARPQLVRRETNPEMYEILTAYKKLTGISCLINTSFNMHEEPIVRAPAEGIKAFQESQLDALILGPFLVRGVNAADASAPVPMLQEQLV